MRAELVVDPLMGTFAEQIEVEIGQDRREAIGILELDDVVAEFGAELVMLRAVGQGADEQAGLVDAVKLGDLAVLADGLDVRGFGQESAHHALAPFGMQSEVVEGVGVAALDNRVGFGRQFRHGLRSRHWTECEAGRSAAH